MRLLLAAIVSCCAAFDASAFVFGRTSAGNPRKWNLLNPPASLSTNVVNRSTRAVRYFLASDAYSSTNTAAELNAIRASFAQWQAVSGTYLKFEDAGMVAPGVDINTSDDQNVVFWAKSDTIVNGGLNDISGALGFTVTSATTDGTLFHADIVFNGVENEWFTDFNSTNRSGNFIEGTALHEIGHLIGLAHSPVGGATMMWVGTSGVDNQAGLSPDEISAVRAHYPTNLHLSYRAALRGQVTKNGSAVLGAAVLLEDGAGNIVAGSVSRSTGNYEVPAVAPGTYQVRVCPLDPSGAPDWMIRGRDISGEFSAADTAFLPTTNRPATLAAGVTNVMNFAVTAGNPPFRISYMRYPTANPGSWNWAPLPIPLRIGQADLTIGVGSADLPTNGATLTITGDGLQQGPISFRTNAFNTGVNFISTRVTVLPEATPGLRSCVVQHGANLAYANGFVEILPPAPDYNFDGLVDTFQRQHFPLWTAAIAGPANDPDNDAFPNSAEAVAGTDPNDRRSRLEIESVTTSMSGALVTWRSVDGRRYQLYSKSVLDVASGWQMVGGAVTASGPLAEKLDPGNTMGTRFYRVEVLP